MQTTQEELEKIPADQVEEVKPKRRGNPALYKGMPPLNPAGINQHSPLGSRKLQEKFTNKQLRERELLALARKFKPYQSKAVQTAVAVIDRVTSSDQNKLKAASILLGFYKDLISEIYSKEYDNILDEVPDEIQKNTPVFSLKMINTEEEEES